MAVDPRNFILNTDYEMDKIVYFTEGSLNAGQYDVDIPHGLGFTPLVFGVCAFNSDFSDARGIPYQELTSTNSISFTIQANATNVRLSYINYEGTPAKIYYRIYAFEPSNSSADVPSTSSNASTFILNTDYNYCKLHSKGIVGANTTITHGLGYIPQVLVWGESNSGWIAPVSSSAVGSYIAITDQDLVLNDSSAANFHYRIYYDEA